MPRLVMMALLMTASALAVVLMFLTLQPLSLQLSGDDGIVADSKRSRRCVIVLDAIASFACASSGDDGIVIDSKCSRSCVNGHDAVPSCTCVRCCGNGNVKDSNCSRSCVMVMTLMPLARSLEVVIMALLMTASAHAVVLLKRITER